MLILLEGLDRTGKTTLATAIAKELQAPVVHKSPPTNDWYLEYVAPLAGYQPGLDLVLDRWHWGEMVWPFAFGRESRLNLAAFRYADNVMAKLGGIAVLGTGDPDALWADCVRDGESIAKAGREAFDKAHRLFPKVAGISVLPTFEYDWRRTPRDDAVSTVIAMAQDAQRTAAFNAAAELERLMEIGVRSIG